MRYLQNGAALTASLLSNRTTAAEHHHVSGAFERSGKTFF
ncbi:hypothetical protein GRAN_3834 [Granulicella sibirica]|uniref:Uncharacterized protein n=1 Tax=Granulicella sibirica TaxID=2479048 RepID=A0A4Q0SXK8_9BACT|nr:hypothetical protein GRAN_3834 [Granulicella sibirica]